MIAVTGSLKYQAQFHDEFLDAVRAVTATTRAQDGCLSYALTPDLLEPHTLAVAELWRDEPAMQQHMSSAHFAQFMTIVGPMIDGMPNIVRHDVSDSRSLFG